MSIYNSDWSQIPGVAYRFFVVLSSHHSIRIECSWTWKNRLNHFLKGAVAQAGLFCQHMPLCCNLDHSDDEDAPNEFQQGCFLKRLSAQINDSTADTVRK